jgi:hypothetical protein
MNTAQRTDKLLIFMGAFIPATLSQRTLSGEISIRENNIPENQ